MLNRILIPVYWCDTFSNIFEQSSYIYKCCIHDGYVGTVSTYNPGGGFACIVEMCNWLFTLVNFHTKDLIFNFQSGKSSFFPLLEIIFNRLHNRSINFETLENLSRLGGRTSIIEYLNTP